MRKSMLCSLALILAMLLCCSCVEGTAGNLLRIDGPDGWTKHIEVDQGKAVSLFVLATKEGYGVLYDQYPDGRVHDCGYYFQRCDHLPYYAEMPGRHVLSYFVNGQESNSVVVDVKCIYSPGPVYPSVAPQAPQVVGQATSIAIQPRMQPVYIGKATPSERANIQHATVGSHFTYYQSG